MPVDPTLVESRKAIAAADAATIGTVATMFAPTSTTTVADATAALEGLAGNLVALGNQSAAESLYATLTSIYLQLQNLQSINEAQSE